MNATDMKIGDMVRINCPTSENHNVIAKLVFLDISSGHAGVQIGDSDTIYGAARYLELVFSI